MYKNSVKQGGYLSRNVCFGRRINIITQSTNDLVPVSGQTRLVGKLPPATKNNLFTSKTDYLHGEEVPQGGGEVKSVKKRPAKKNSLESFMKNKLESCAERGAGGKQNKGAKRAKRTRDVFDDDSDQEDNVEEMSCTEEGGD